MCSAYYVVLKIAIFQPELQEHAPRTTFGAAGVCSAYYVCT